MVGNTVPEFGIQHIMLEEPPPESPFVQLDLRKTHDIDTVAIVPAVIDFQGSTQKPYAFPLRFRLDASDDPEFRTYTPLLVHTDVDYSLPTVSPVVVRRPGTRARYLRLTVNKLAYVEGRWTFALAELMALNGKRNVALNALVSHKGGTGLMPRWHSDHVTDGRTPLGPPIDRASIPQFDALFAGIRPEVRQPWMMIDLGRDWVLDEVRLHPLHSRQGADVPGFAFPSRFKVEAAKGADFEGAETVFETGNDDFPNPGNNPVTIPANGVRGRFVRITSLAAQTPSRLSFALSEMEVYAGGVNVSRGSVVDSSGDSRRDFPRPLSLLTDGHTSYGRLLELPEWLQVWERRKALETSIANLQEKALVAEEAKQKRLAVLLSIMGLVSLVAATLVFWRTHQRYKREREAFRTQLARDMHDEIGSNLAGIAVISETSSQRPDSSSEDWKEVNRIARETSDAMREVLWLIGARQESGIALMEHLQRASKRLLPAHEVRWVAVADNLPSLWPAEARREVFLFFKEAMTNIQRHAKASQVEIFAIASDHTLELRIEDDGQGFNAVAKHPGMGIASLYERARRLGGTCEIESSPGRSKVILRVPLPDLCS